MCKPLWEISEVLAGTTKLLRMESQLMHSVAFSQTGAEPDVRCRNEKGTR
jgi:hypothetical protein